ncbi:MAG: MFS transporter [Myxococcales bacterium]|nr:MFS transporter [Myxococcales bacterium]
MTRQPSIRPFYPTAATAGMVMISLGPLLDAVLRDFGADRAQGGLLSLMFFGGMCVAILAINFVLGKLSSKATLMLGIAAQGLGLFLAGGAADSLRSLTACYALIGFGYGFPAIYPGMCVTSLIKPSAERPLGLINGFFAIGVLATPVVIGQALTRGVSWRGVLIGEGILSLVLLVYYLTTTLPDIPNRQNVRPRQLAEIRRANPRLVLVILLALWLYVGAENIFNVWLAKFQIDIFASRASRAGLTVSLFWLGLTVGRFGAVRLMGRFRTTGLISAAGWLMALGIAAVSLSPWRWVSEGFCFVTGLASAAIFPLIASYVGRFPAWFSGVVFSLGYLAATVGAMFFPYLVGPAADWVGFRLAMFSAALPCAVVALLAGPLDRAAAK